MGRQVSATLGIGARRSAASSVKLPARLQAPPAHTLRQSQRASQSPAARSIKPERTNKLCLASFVENGRSPSAAGLSWSKERVAKIVFYFGVQDGSAPDLLPPESAAYFVQQRTAIADNQL